MLLGVSVFYLWPSHGNPPGFHRDEASISLNAYAIAETGADQDGRRLPLFFLSYGGYFSPIIVYLMAGVYRIAGASPDLARAVGGAAVVAAIGALALLAGRRTRSVCVAVTVGLLAALTPWLYELGRTSLEMTIEPVFLVAVLLAGDWAVNSRRALLVRATPLAVTLAGLTYSYAGGRALAPLLAAALVVLGRRHLRLTGTVWVLYSLTWIPLVTHWAQVRARYDQTSFVKGDMSALEVAGSFVWNYLQDINLWKLTTAGDDRPYIHTWGSGQLLAVVVGLAMAGGGWILLRSRDGWWRWMLACTVLTPIPAALATDRLHAERLVPLAVMLLVLAIPAIQGIERAVRAHGRAATALAVVLVAGVLAQAAHAFANIDRHGRERTLVYDAAVPSLLHMAFSGTGPIYVDYDDRYTQTHAVWYAATHDIDPTRVVVLADGGVPATGATFFGRLQECDFICTRTAEGDSYWLARVDGPRPLSSG